MPGKSIAVPGRTLERLVLFFEERRQYPTGSNAGVTLHGDLGISGKPEHLKRRQY
jgi:hypothetical protein